MAALSPVQKKALALMAKGTPLTFSPALSFIGYYHPSVYVGRHKFSMPTLEKLERLGYIEEGQTEGIWTTYTITQAGRAAIENG